MALLDAAERLFADRGYRGASMQAIAEAAGLSRGMPGYVFSTKERLYEAVLERAFAAPRRQVAEMTPNTSSSGSTGSTETLSGWVMAYLQFLATHPTYVRLMQRAALDGDERIRASPANSAALTEGVAALERLNSARHRSGTLGVDRDDPDFVTDTAAHIIDLLTHGALAG